MNVEIRKMVTIASQGIEDMPEHDVEHDKEVAHFCMLAKFPRYEAKCIPPRSKTALLFLASL